MDLFRVVGGPLSLAPGETISLDARQLAVRADRVEVLGEDGERRIVRATAHQQFKVGEEIGLPEPLSRYLAAGTVPASEPIVASPQPASPAVRKPKKRNGAPSKPTAPVAAAIPTGPQGLARA